MDPYSINEVELQANVTAIYDDAWKYMFTCEYVRDTFERYPKDKACGRDHITAEARQYATCTDERVLRGITYAFSQHMMHDRFNLTEAVTIMHTGKRMHQDDDKRRKDKPTQSVTGHASDGRVREHQEGLDGQRVQHGGAHRPQPAQTTTRKQAQER